MKNELVKNKTWKVPTRMIIDFETGHELIQSLGDEKFVEFINNMIVITTDEETMYYLNEIKRKHKAKKIKNGSK